jgi:hypothetical protein
MDFAVALRLQDSNYKTVIHTGINEKGETKPSPLDGFCLIPNSSPPHFILVEHTINDSNLERKWLQDHTKVKSKSKRKKPGPEIDGDVLKAGRRATEIRKDFPDAVFTLALCTNQLVNENLANNVYQQASMFGMNVDILEFSRLTDFLNHNSDGQYLRKKFLGIEAERVSRSLLKDLSQKGIEEYEANIYLTDKQQELVERPIINSLLEEVLWKVNLVTAKVRWCLQCSKYMLTQVAQFYGSLARPSRKQLMYSRHSISHYTHYNPH